MIISASRRTDIPAFYASWFINRIRAGFCVVPNPYNQTQTQRISLSPDTVDTIVFWTKNPNPLVPHLAELKNAGYRFYFQFTLNDYPPELEPRIPPVGKRLADFGYLSERLGEERVIWRYDPVVVSNRTSYDFHRDRFSSLCAALGRHTRRVMVSTVHFYRKTTVNLSRLGEAEWLFDQEAANSPEMKDLLTDLAKIAFKNGLDIFSCASPRDWSPAGILPGCCIDGELIEALWGIRRPWKKDPGQRKACGCVVSKDIGVIDSCLHGCRYCYSTMNRQRAILRHGQHDPTSPMLIGKSNAVPTAS